MRSTTIVQTAGTRAGITARTAVNINIAESYDLFLPYNRFSRKDRSGAGESIGDSREHILGNRTVLPRTVSLVRL